MRKVMLLAAMLAMVLAAAAPAFGQATAIDEGGTGTQYNVEQENEQVAVVNDSICTNVAQAAQNQYNAGDQNAATTGDGDISQIANEAGVSQGQVIDCFNTQVVGDNNNTAGGLNNVAVGEGEDEGLLIVEDEVTTVSAAAEETVVVEDEAEVVAGTDAADTTVVADAGEEIVVAEGEDTTTVVAEGEDTTTVVATEGELPSTGGASVLALGAGVLLVAGGLVARRIVR